MTALGDVEDLFSTRHADALHRWRSDDDGRELNELRTQLLTWYDKGARELPWRSVARDASVPEQQRGYAVWVSEIMLQQTRVQTVLEYYERWMKRWPTVGALAAATQEQVNEVWAGLGYYRRARYLLEGARAVCGPKWGGALPRTAAELKQIPGIGDYTAGAIASIAFGQRAPLVDGNVIRVFSRMRAVALPPQNKTSRELCWALADAAVPADRPGDFNQALMELGATVCTPTSPACSACPVASLCLANRLVQASARDAARRLGAADGGSTSASASAGTSAASASAPVVECGVCAGAALPAPPITSVTVFPAKAEKAAPRELSVASLVLRHGKTFLVVKRPDDGLLAGLWEFPNAEVEADAPPAALRDAAVDCIMEVLRGGDSLRSTVSSAARSVGAVGHLFTHIRQTIHVHECRVAESEARPAVRDASTARWIESASDAAVSTGMKKVLHACEHPPKASAARAAAASAAPSKRVKAERAPAPGSRTLLGMWAAAAATAAASEPRAPRAASIKAAERLAVLDVDTDTDADADAGKRRAGGGRGRRAAGSKARAASPASSSSASIASSSSASDSESVADASSDDEST